MKKNQLIFLSLSALAVGFAASTQAATIFSDNFDSYSTGTYTVPTGPGSDLWTQAASGAGGSGGTFSVADRDTSGSEFEYRLATSANLNTTQGRVLSASIDLSSSTSLLNTSFSFTSDLNILATAIPTSTSYYARAGIVALGSNMDFAAGSNYSLYYEAVSSTSANVGYLYLVGNGITLQKSASLITVSTSSNYSFTLDGFYDGSGQLSLAGSLTDGTTTITVGGTDNVPLTGAYWGVFAKAAKIGSGSNSTSITADFDNIIIATIPEPSTYTSIVGVMFLGFAVLRRRR